MIPEPAFFVIATFAVASLFTAIGVCLGSVLANRRAAEREWKRFRVHRR